MMTNSPSFSDVGFKWILLEKLELGRFTPRKRYNGRYVDELADSIKNVNQLKPIVVRPHPKLEDVYEVIDGVHRVQALMKLGRLYVRAEIHYLLDEEADCLALKINQMHGKRLDELEEALHIAKLMEIYEWTQNQVAEKFNRSQSWVSRRLLLITNTSSELLEAIITRVINTSVGREIAELSIEYQPEVVLKVKQDRLSSRETELLVHAIKERPEQKKEIMSKSIVELTQPPGDIQEFEKEYGSDRPKLSRVACPHCSGPLAVNWVLGRVGRAERNEDESGY